MSEDQVYDCILIGSGLGSLAMASLLAKSGKKVLVLEKATEYGGCASSYTRSGYRYEAGATTLVGWEKGLPLQRLFSLLGVSLTYERPLLGGEIEYNYEGLRLIRLQPAMKIFLGSKVLTRSEDRSAWIQDCGKFFGEEESQSRFWRLVFFLSDSVWDTSRRMTHFPPVRFRDYFDCLKKFRPRDLLLLLSSFFTLRSLLRLPGFPKSREFRKFLDEQLLITVQTTHERSPLSMGAAGISYAHLVNTYVVGGIGELANFLVQTICRFGGEVKNREEVDSIQLPTAPDTYFSVHTRKGNTYFAQNVFSGIPIWNTAAILGIRTDPTEKMGGSASRKGLDGFGCRRYRKLTKTLKKEIQSRVHRFSREIWGAFTISIAMKDFRNRNDPIHYQFHLEETLPHGGGDSIFVSCSHPEDTSRFAVTGSGLDNVSDVKQPNSYERILLLAISTHIRNPESWNRKDPDYLQKKEEIQNQILNHLEKHWEGFERSAIFQIQSASPDTWRVWTGRYFGRVGGLPGFYFRNPFRFPSSLTPFHRFYLLGDTVYPGQGIPAVVLGALNLFYQLNLD